MNQRLGGSHGSGDVSLRALKNLFTEEKSKEERKKRKRKRDRDGEKEEEKEREVSETWVFWLEPSGEAKRCALYRGLREAVRLHTVRKCMSRSRL